MAADAVGNLLRLRGLTLERETASGCVTLLSDLDLDLRRGECLALLGANGSGKTSLLHYLAGDESPLGVSSALIAQDPDEQIVAASVREEVRLGRRGLDADAVLASYGLHGLAGLDPRVLSAGQKQRLGVAVALAGGPEVLLADEPTALQDGEQASWLRSHLAAWRARTGGTLLLATQNRGEAAAADRCLLLDGGRCAASGTPREVLESESGRELLGEGNERGATWPLPPEISEPAVSISTWRGLAMRFATGGFSAVDLDLAPGARIGLTGPNGCGKSSLLAAAVGLREVAAGTIELRGRRLKAGDLDHGLALLAPQFPEYFFTRGTVEAEVELDPRLAERGVGAVLSVAGLPAAMAARNPHALSSGEKRRLAVAMVLLSERPLLLLDEPTAGLDRPARRLLKRMLAAVPTEAALVIASHDEGFLRGCCARVVRLTERGLVEG